MAGPPPKLLVASLVLLLLASSLAAAPPDPPSAAPSPQPPGTPQPLGYLQQAGSVAGDLLGRLSLPSAQKKIWDAYEKGSAAVMTYTGILTDQLYHWWQGDQ